MAWNRLRFARTTEALRAVTTYMRGEPIMPTDGANANKLFVGDGSTVGGNRVFMAGDTFGTSQLADDAVSNAKLANMVTATLKGRNTAGTGDPEDLSVATVLDLLGIGTAWSAITPTVVSSAGTLTSASGGIRYRQLGKLVFGAATATIATNGTGASAVDIATASLPTVSTTLSPIATAGGFESGLTNKALSVALFTFSGTTTLRCRFYDGLYPGANSARMSVTFLYEAA